jgi:hypothetical protein
MQDYTHIQELRSNQGTLMCHRRNHLYLAVICKSFSLKPLQMLEFFAQMQHPNIADILDMYFHNGQLWIVSEYLDISLLELEFNRMAPEEWEIATIVAEVARSWFMKSKYTEIMQAIKAITYPLDAVPTCELHIDSVRLTLQGDIKLSMPSFYYCLLQLIA